MADAEGAAANRQPVRRPAPDQPLPVALPASLGLEPARLHAMRTSLFVDSHPLQVTRLPWEVGLDMVCCRAVCGTSWHGCAI
jgi:hypothetical protein